MASRPESRGRPRLDFERRVLLLGFLTGLPGMGLALILLWTGAFSPRTQWTFTFLLLASWSWLVFRMRDRLIRPIQTLSNLMGALLEGDYSLRTREQSSTDTLGLAFREINELGRTMRDQRLGALDATALLRKVMEEVDVALFVFDHEQRLRLVNRSGERVLGRPSEWLLGQDAATLDLAGALADDGPRTLDATFPGRAGRWEIRGTLQPGESGLIRFQVKIR